MALKTNYKEDILNTAVNTKRKYNMINNSDGTVSFEDVTVYTQLGDTFGAADINNTNSRIEEVFQCASDGKALIAEAVTGKGIETSADDTYEQMADNIKAIATDPIIDVSYADESAIYADKHQDGTATTSITLLKNSTYIVTSFYSFAAFDGSFYGVNCTVTDIEVTNTSGELSNLKNYNNASRIKDNDDYKFTSWRGYRVDRIVTSDIDSNYTASCTMSSSYEKLLYLNIVAVRIE